MQQQLHNIGWWYSASMAGLNNTAATHHSGVLHHAAWCLEGWQSPGKGIL